MEDTPRPKPDPASVELAMQKLGVRLAWMLGDTPDDARAARAAGVCPVGVVAPGEDGDVSGPALLGSGAGRVVDGVGSIMRDLTLLTTSPKMRSPSS